eukprot:TRINITY_DN4680_c3_g2_i1.p1 TRINITY_DN4680_c3_g2~~TRINITY_DN4680_c3_g2_i1.p1  ORF type:complete len:946 (-),score=219.54 TRINITY_DN4680_c3_g2_i1:1559-4396(-)
MESGKVEYLPDIITAEEVRDSIEDVGFTATIKSIHLPHTGNASLAAAGASKMSTDIFKVEGMTCSSCVNIIESVLKGTDGISDAVVNLTTEKARVSYDPQAIGVRSIVRAIEDVGFHAAPWSEFHDNNAGSRTSSIDKLYSELLLSLCFTGPLFLLKMAMMFIPPLMEIMMMPVYGGVSLTDVTFFTLATPCQFYVGKRFYLAAYNSLKHGAANMDVLVSLATSIAYSYSVLAMCIGLFNPDFKVNTFFDTSSMLISFILFGKYLETIAKGKASDAITKLMGLRASNAILLTIGKDGAVINEEEISAELVERGDVLKVVPGSTIPADAVVVYGSSYVDESMLTGEPMPVIKSLGDTVSGGTMNSNGMLHVKATRVGADTSLSQIIRLVEEAQTSKAPIQAFADRVSGVFVPTVISLGLLTFLVWLVLCSFDLAPQDLVDEESGGFLFSLLMGINVVIIACPCALGLATPTAVMVGTGVGAQNGVLIKGGLPLETAHKVTAIIFDKTGTLTEGKPQVVRTVILDRSRSTIDLYRLIGAAEQCSEHPLASALVSHAKVMCSTHEVDLVANTGTATSFPQVEHFQNVAGRGVACDVGGTHVVIGSRQFMLDNHLNVDDATRDQIRAIECEAQTVVCVAIDGCVSALVAIADKVKGEARAAIATLESMGIVTCMVTGDNRNTANVVARSIGIDNVFAETLPGGKSEKVRELQRLGHVVAMVGDGINDSPALAAADVGIAIGAGTDIALEAADMVLVRNDLRDVVTAIDLSKKTFRRIQLNYLWAMIYNMIGIPVAAGVLVPVGFIIHPLIAGLAMAFSSVSVVSSSLMLKLYVPPEVTESSLFDQGVELQEVESLTSMSSSFFIQGQDRPPSTPSPPLYPPSPPSHRSPSSHIIDMSGTSLGDEGGGGGGGGGGTTTTTTTHYSWRGVSHRQPSHGVREGGVSSGYHHG